MLTFYYVDINILRGVITMPKKNSASGMIVNRTISLPFTVLESVIEEADVMGKSFSEATTVLLRIGISQRRIERSNETESLKK